MNGEYIIKIVGLVRGGLSVHDRRFLVDYDPTLGKRGEVYLKTSPFPDQAKRFADHEAARQEWIKVDTREPIRADGKPNRPLTAYTVAIIPLDKAGEL